jgi:phosphatidylserine decarboxylase
MIGLSSGSHKLLFAQVAGYIARRIVCPVKQGDTLRIGERFGMIKFGSRVDLYLPIDVTLNCKIGDRTVAGETLLAEFP